MEMLAVVAVTVIAVAGVVAFEVGRARMIAAMLNTVREMENSRHQQSKQSDMALVSVIREQQETLRYMRDCMTDYDGRVDALLDRLLLVTDANYRAVRVAQEEVAPRQSDYSLFPDQYDYEPPVDAEITDNPSSGLD